MSLVLAFVGAKMLLASVYEIPIAISLATIVTVLAGAIVASLLRPRKPLLPALPGLTDQPAASRA